MSRGRKQSKHLSAFNGVESDASDSDVQVAHLSRRRQHRRLLTRQRVSTPQSRVASRARVSKVTAPTRRHTSPTDVQLQRSASDDGDCANNCALRYAQIVRTMGQCSYLSPQHRKFVTTTAGTYSKYFIDESLSSSIGECLEDVHRGRNYSSPYCHGSTGSGSLSETNSSSSRYVSGVSSCADSLSSCADTVIAPFALPLRETLIYECFLLSLGAVPATCIRAASSVVNRAIVTLRNQAIVARTVFMQIYYKVVIVYNKRYEITHRLMANDIFVAVTSAENRQLLGVIVNSPQKDHYICHVFGTDEQLLFHYAHEKYTKRYGIKCTRVRDGSMLFCNEFPHSAVTVVRNINYMQDSPRIEAPQRCITSQPTRYASRDLRYTHRILSSLSDVFESNSEATTTTGSQSFSMQRPSLSTVSSKAARRNSEVYNRIGVLPMTLIDSPLIQQKAVADLLGFSRRRNIRYKNIGERAMTEKRADLMIKHSSLNVMVINDEKEDANDGDLCDHECDDHVNAIASFSDGERSRHRKQIVSTDERGENAAAWPRPRGREVLANVAVEERILSQQCADRPVINPATQTLTATQQSDPHPSDLLKQSLLQSDHFVEDCSKKREDRVLEIKEYVEKREAGSKAPNTSNPPPLADTPNSTVTVQERVGEPECEPMANGEHTQASGLCSDRSSSDVERILHNPVYRRPFQQFLEQQFCAENINFYVAVEEYRSIPDNEMERRSKVARQIYERHFTANSIEPVNIDNSTSRCIRDAVMAQRFSAQLYDVAQYQIFHLLKYDCWPRYLRAGGVAPNFDDARGEDHPGPSTQPTQPSQQQSGDKKRKSLLWRGLKPRFSRRKKESRTTSSIQSYSNGGSPQTAETRSCGGVETDRHSPVERFASGGTPTAIVSSPLSVGGQIARVTFSGPPCSPQPCGSFDSVGDEQLGEVFSATDASMSTRMTWSGSKRRHRFTNLGKQFSVPAELSYGQRGTSARGSSSTSVSPNRSRQLTSEVCTRFCTLMHNEIASSEQIPLSDPTESVGKWTSVMAAKRGMDPRATEAVDAQSLSTIDPARQAMDALNNRCVCLVPVLHFAVEILAPNASTKTGSSNSRIVLLRTRHGLSSGVVLRSVLSKFSLDYDACVAVLSGTLEVIASHISVGTVGSRCITVMTQQQYQERQHSPKREIVKDALISAHLLSPDANVPFFQHGDVAFFELPPDFDPRTGKINAARSYSNAKTEHTSGLLKFVRKASQAVTSREQDAVAPSSSTHQAHHHSGHNHHSSTMTSSYAHKIRRKSVDTFQRASSATAASDIPYCGENNFSDEQYAKSVDKRPEANASTEPTVASRASVQTPADGRGKVYELPDFLRRENCLDSSSVDTGESKLRYCAESVTSRGANGNATRIPPIYASAVPSKKDLTPCEVEKSIVWQPADYV